jgi:hypothetical protein
MDRRAFTVGAFALLTAPLTAEGQPREKVHRIGWLHPQPLPKQWLAGFDQGLREFGYVEGKDLVIERLWATVTSIGFPQWQQNSYASRSTYSSRGIAVPSESSRRQRERSRS